MDHPCRSNTGTHDGPRCHERGGDVPLSQSSRRCSVRRLALVVTLGLVVPLFGQSSTYRITQTYTLGGDGSWDYIVPDPPRHRLFIGRQNRVMVVDENGGTLLGEVTGINGAHGTALVEHTSHGVATSGNDGVIVMFDPAT